MTSYTRKLHEVAPAAALEIHRQQFHAYRYGRHVTLAQFTPEYHAFGKRSPHACATHCGDAACKRGCVLARIKR